MKKKYIVLILVFLLATTGLALLFTLLQRTKSTLPTRQIPTPTKTTLSIVETTPKNNEKSVVLNSVISITFDKPVSPQDVSITITPDQKFSISPFENVLILQPNILSKETSYTVSIASKKMGAPYSFSFVTSSKNSEGVGPFPEAIKQIEESQRTGAPHIFLANHLPHEETTFSMTPYLNWTTGINTFNVGLKGPDSIKSKQDAIAWMKSLELTDQQISTLIIAYVNNNVILLKEHLPYYGTYFNVTYDRSADKTTITIYKETQSQGEQELDNFLKSKSIQDRSEINNLEVRYL